jgi:hypothetical protein
MRTCAPKTVDARRHIHALDLLDAITSAMHENDVDDAELAHRMGVTETAVHDMLSLDHDLTIREISEIEQALGTTILRCDDASGLLDADGVPSENELAQRLADVDGRIVRVETMVDGQSIVCDHAQTTVILDGELYDIEEHSSVTSLDDILRNCRQKPLFAHDGKLFVIDSAHVVLDTRTQDLVARC